MQNHVMPANTLVWIEACCFVHSGLYCTDICRNDVLAIPLLLYAENMAVCRAGNFFIHVSLYRSDTNATLIEFWSALFSLISLLTMEQPQSIDIPVDLSSMYPNTFASPLLSPSHTSPLASPCGSWPGSPSYLRDNSPVSPSEDDQSSKASSQTFVYKLFE